MRLILREDGVWLNPDAILRVIKQHGKYFAPVTSGDILNLPKKLAKDLVKDGRGPDPD